MPRVTVTIIALNEAERLPAALASVAWADEIVLLDSGSTDATPDLARAAGAVVANEPWQGFGPHKNRAATIARNDWIFNLDADERVDPALAAAIAALGDTPDYAAYTVRRRNYVGGRALRHWPWGWDLQVRLYDRRRARFSPVRVHESVQSDGPVGRLDGVIEHLTYRDWDDCARRHERYAATWAETARAAGKRAAAWKPPCAAIGAFLREWLARGYILSGIDGWRWSLASARYASRKYRLLRG